MYTLELSYSFLPAELLSWNLIRRTKMYKLQSFLLCTGLVHKNLLYYLNFDNTWLRYCKTVYNHYKNIFTFLPDHLRSTPGSYKINFITCLSGHKRNKMLAFLCHYYTTMLKQNICYTSPFYVVWLFFLFALKYLFSTSSQALKE